jgi:hypothetical protein
VNSVLESAASSMPYFKELEQPSASIAEKERIKSQMVKGNFVIGDEKNRTMKNVETSYKPAVAFQKSSTPINK